MNYSLTRDWTHALSSKSLESKPLDIQKFPPFLGIKIPSEFKIIYNIYYRWEGNICIQEAYQVRSGQVRSIDKSCPTLCDPMNCSTPGPSVQHQLLEFTQIHVHRVSDAIQPSHPLWSPSPPAPNPSQHQNLFQWVNSSPWGGQSTGVSALPSVLPMNTQDWSPLEWTGWISLQSKRLSRVFSNTTVQTHQFFGTQPSSQFNSHIHTWPQE